MTTTTATCEQPIRYVAGTHGPVPVRCTQSRYITRWLDAAGHEHLACPRHLAKRTHLYPPVGAPEPAVPGVFVSEAEAWALWGMTARESYKRDGAHTHFDERDANLADCPACERAEARA